MAWVICEAQWTCGDCHLCTRCEEEESASHMHRVLCGVVIVEFWARMSGALPFGWAWEEVPAGQYAYHLQVIGFGEALLFPDLVQCAASERCAHDELPPKAWAAEYRARPRLEE